MKAKIFLLILLVLFNPVACSQNPNAPMDAAVPPTSTPFAAETEPILADDLATPTPWVGGTQTAQAFASQAPSTTDVQAVIEKPTDFSPVLYGGKIYDSTFFLLLGGVGTDEWLAPDESAARFSGEVTYSLHTLTQEYRYFLWGKVPELSPTCQNYFVKTDAVLDEAGFIGVVDGWNITKRAAAELSADVEFYQQAVLDWLADGGVDDPQPGTLQIFRVDVEGDGSDEIFISATRLDKSQHATQAGDYSVVLMRRVAGNDAVTIPLVADIYSSKEIEITYPRTYSLANFIDLNQDGVLEVVVDIQQWEGFGAIIYQIEGQDVHQALRVEC